MLELPPTKHSPIDVTSVSGFRLLRNALFDLEEAITFAAACSTNAMSQVSERFPHLLDPGTATLGNEADVRFIALERAVAEASRWVGPISGLELWHDDGIGSIEVHSRSGWSSFALDLPTLSSGEAKWLDMGLALATRDLNDFGREMNSLAERVESASEQEIAATAEDRATELEQLNVTSERWLSSSDLRVFLELFPVSPSRRETSRGSVLLIDEPEQHLHPIAQESVAKCIRQIGGERQVATATHSHHFLGENGWDHVFMFQPAREGVVHKQFRPRDLRCRDDIATTMGLTSGELLAFTRYVLFVEGSVDELVLTDFYGRELRQAGVKIVPLDGLSNATALADFRLIGEVADIRIGVLADNIRVRHLRSDFSGSRSWEESELLNISSVLESKGLSGVVPFELRRPDITCYLNDESIRRRFSNSDFPGWSQIIQGCYDSKAPGGCVKSQFEKFTGRKLTVRTVRWIIDQMNQDDSAPHPELREVVADILERAQRTP